MRRAFSALLALLLLSASCFAEDVCVYRKGMARGQVALTFDDGPHSAYTREILQILKDFGVRATFFVIGENARQYPDILREIHAAGHEIGNHTDSHAFLKNLTLASTCKEVSDAAKTIEEIVGVRPHVFRPPGGSYSDAKIAALSDMGYVSVLWSKDTRDWTCPSVQSVVNSATQNLSDGDIILFHDFNGKNSPTPEALRKIIPIIKEQGFSCVTVSEVLAH